MPILRLAYTTQFLIALLAVFLLWSEVGGQSHLDLMPWYLKLGLGLGVAFATVRATAGAVSHERAWNGQTLRWAGILLALLVGCGLASYYYHVYGEQDEEQDDQSLTSSLVEPVVPVEVMRVGRATLVGDAQAYRAGIRDKSSSRLGVGARRPSSGGPHRAGHVDASR